MNTVNVGADCPDSVVQRVLEIAPKQFQAGHYRDLLIVLEQAIVYIDTLDQKVISKVRIYYKLTEVPAYSKPGDRIHHPKLTTLLDYRATVYEKTGDKQRAIVDTRRMINVEPYNSKGYIRLVKLYRAINIQRALEVGQAGIRRIEHGVKKYKIKVNDRNMTVLQNLVSEIQITIQKEKTKVKEKEQKMIKRQKVEDQKEKKVLNLDISHVFPSEIFERILSNLRTTEILKLLSISKSWYDAIANMSLFQEINMKHQTGFRDLQNCYKVIKSKRVRELNLPSIRRPDELKLLTYLISKSNVSIIDKLQVNSLDVNLKQIVQLISHRNNIESIQTLVLSCVIDLNFEYHLIQKLKNLHTLIISPTGFIQSSPALSRVPSQILRKLRHLEITNDVKKPVPFQKLFEWDESTYPNMETLIFKSCNFAKINQVNQHYNFLNKFPNIVNVIFENNINYSFQQVLTNINEFSHLNSFQLNEVSCAKNNVFTNFLINQQIFQNNIQFIFQNLTVLNISHSSIQFSALLKILQITSNLRKLNIGRCPNLYFKSGPLDNNPHVFQFNEFLRYVSGLTTLQLDESLNFNDYALTEFINVIKSTDGLTELKNLDLSNNLNISGYKLLELVQLRPLDLLVINGVDIKPETITLMQNRKWVGTIECKLNIQGTYRMIN